MRVLVTGAAGFVGRAVIAELSTRPAGVEVVALEHPAVAYPGGLAVDLARTPVPAITRLFEQVSPNVVINCAGRVAGGDDELIQANVLLVRNLLDAIGAAGRPVRLIHLGSGAEYGPGPPGVARREADPVRPVGLYGRTKALATDLVVTAVDHHGLDGTVLRVFNPIGPGATAQSVAGVAAQRIRDAVERGESTLEMGPLGAARDLVDIREVASAIAAAALVSDVPPVLNVGSGRATVVRDLVAELMRAAGWTGTVREARPRLERSRGVDWQAADIALASVALGWAPHFDLRSSAQDQWTQLIREQPISPLVVGGARTG